VSNNRQNRRARLLGWWYASIAAGFLLLAIANALWGGNPWLVALRVVIAAGFAYLARAEFRKLRR
jgi:hypothetical protein